MNIIPDPKVVLVQAAGFIVILVIFKLFLFKPILGVLDARRREIESRYEAAEADRRAAEESKAAYEKHLAGVEEEIRSKITDAVKEGQKMREEIISDSRTRADEMLEKARDEIVREKEKAMVELKGTVADLAVSAAGKIIRESMDEPKHRQLVSRFIDEVNEAAR